MLETLLHEARSLANNHSAHSDTKGMASVGVRWNPYEAKWEAEASWSDNTRVVSTPSDSTVDVILELIDLLKES